MDTAAGLQGYRESITSLFNLSKPSAEYCPINTCSCSARFVSYQWQTLPPGPCVTRFIWNNMGLLRCLWSLNQRWSWSRVLAVRKATSEVYKAIPKVTKKDQDTASIVHKQPVSERWSPVSKGVSGFSKIVVGEGKNEKREREPHHYFSACKILQLKGMDY